MGKLKKKIFIDRSLQLCYNENDILILDGINAELDRITGKYEQAGNEDYTYAVSIPLGQMETGNAHKRYSR